jgi:hypothetical protein
LQNKSGTMSRYFRLTTGNRKWQIPQTSKNLKIDCIISTIDR